MTKSTPEGAVLKFYDTHPINEQQIMDKLRRDGQLSANVSEDVLQNYDQDHYGGVDANDALARLAGIGEQSHVLDVCCGLGGPSRYLAHKYGCRVTGIDLTASRIEGARRLTSMAGLEDRITFQTANALEMPFEDKSFDVVISQEAFCHIPNKRQLIGECARVLRPGGNFAFTDVLTTATTTESAADRLQCEMTMFELGSIKFYRDALEDAGCEILDIQDTGDKWRDILVDRLQMYRQLGDQTIDRFGKDHFEKWDSAYAFFVSLYQTGALGGGRFLARRLLT